MQLGVEAGGEEAARTMYWQKNNLDSSGFVETSC
jgi:hypothetical protein